MSQSEEAECPLGHGLRPQTALFHVKRRKQIQREEGTLKVLLTNSASTGLLAECEQG